MKTKGGWIQSDSKGERGFTLVETLIAILLMAGAFSALAASIPLAAIIHRGALQREQALALAQAQLEFFLTNPGPFAGDQGNQSNFVNGGQFPPGFTGSFRATQYPGSIGLTLIVVSVTPPNATRVELSAIDTTFSNIVPAN